MADRDGAGLAATAILGPAGVPTETRTTVQAATRPYPTATLPAGRADADARGIRPAGPPRPRPRSRWLIAVILLAAAVVAASLLTPLLSRSGVGAPQPSTALTPSVQPTPSIPTPEASPKPSPQDSGKEQASSPLADVREVVDTLVAQGQLDPRSAEEFGHRLDSLARKLDDGRKDAGKQVDDLSRYLTKLVKNGELTPAGARRIGAALARV